MRKKRRLRTSWLFAAKMTGNFPFDFHFIRHERTNQVQCSYCGNFFIMEMITRDHIYPKSLEGTHTTPSCNPCNIAKENKRPIEWALFATETEIAFGKEWVLPKNRVQENSDCGDVNG